MILCTQSPANKLVSKIQNEFQDFRLKQAESVIEAKKGPFSKV